VHDGLLLLATVALEKIGAIIYHAPCIYEINKLHNCFGICSTFLNYVIEEEREVVHVSQVRTEAEGYTIQIHS